MKHPLDEAFNITSSVEFDIENQYELAEVPKSSVPGEAIADVKDEDDIVAEARMDEIYTTAIEAYHNQAAYTEMIDPKYAARNAEVAANYLNIALNATVARSRQKTDRMRIRQFIPYNNQGGKNTTNVVVASREDILKMITIDGNNTELK